MRNRLGAKLIINTSLEWKEVRCGSEQGMEVGACRERKHSEVNPVCLQAHLGGRRDRIGSLFVRPSLGEEGCHFKHGPGQGNTAQNTMNSQGAQRNTFTI